MTINLVWKNKDGVVYMSMIKREELEKIVEMKLALLKEIGQAERLTTGIREELLSFYQDLYEENDLQHFGWEEENKLVACAGGFLKNKSSHSFSESTNYGLLGDVYSRDRDQEKIVKLTEQVINWFKRNGVEEIRLFASEAGRDIYKDLGFAGAEIIGSNFFNKFLRF